MQQILVYADSLSWGIVPTTRQRFAFDSRWPGVLEITLDGRGRKARVIEDCLNGRRTVWDDPFKPAATASRAWRSGAYSSHGSPSTRRSRPSACQLTRVGNPRGAGEGVGAGMRVVIR